MNKQKYFSSLVSSDMLCGEESVAPVRAEESTQRMTIFYYVIKRLNDDNPYFSLSNHTKRPKQTINKSPMKTMSLCKRPQLL